MGIPLHEYVILKILSANNRKPINGRILLQKIAFLIAQNFPNLIDELDFKPHKFGPYSEIIETAITELSFLEEIKGADKKRGGNLYITDRGYDSIKGFENIGVNNQKFAEFLVQLDFITESIKNDFKDFNTDEMLAFIYKSYPEYISDSIKAERLDYEAIFINLYERGLLGISKIAELMGWTYEEAMDHIIKKIGRLRVQ